MGRALRGGLSQFAFGRSHSRHGDRAGEGGNARRRRRRRSALSIWVRALAEGGEAAGEIKSDAAGHQSDWASGKITIVIFRSASGIAPPVPRRNVSQTGRVRTAQGRRTG